MGNKDTTAFKAKLSSLFAVLAIAGCEPAHPAFDTLHPRATTDCSRHIDGSFYSIDGQSLVRNDVSAVVFRVNNSTLIEVVYWVQNGDVLRLDSSRFTAVAPSGETLAVAKPALLLNPLVSGEDPKLGDLPTELRGDGSVRGRDRHPTENTTMYRVVITFDSALPEQFDLHSPDVRLKDKKYPVRIFGFRNSTGTGLGLCD
jgi:hypothetical protein